MPLLNFFGIGTTQDTYNTKAIFAPEAPTVGTLTAINSTSFVFDGGTFSVNELAGKVVQIQADGTTHYAIIAGNTADTITLSQTMLVEAVTGDTVRILDTHYISPEVVDFPQIYGCYPTQYTGALVMPLVVENLERKDIRLYIESLNENNRIVVICQSTQGFFSNQYRWLELVNDKESVVLSGHFFTTNLHWDVIGGFGIKRYLAAYFSAFELANNTDPQYIPAANFNEIKSRRFACRTIAGVKWCEYNSLIPNTFIATFGAQITKTGAVGETTINFVKYTAATDTTAPLLFEATTRFGAGTGTQNIQLQQPVELSYGDSITVTITRSGGNITLDEFSNIIISEL